MLPIAGVFAPLKRGRDATKKVPLLPGTVDISGMLSTEGFTAAYREPASNVVNELPFDALFRRGAPPPGAPPRNVAMLALLFAFVGASAAYTPEVFRRLRKSRSRTASAPSAAAPPRVAPAIAPFPAGVEKKARPSGISAMALVGCMPAPGEGNEPEMIGDSVDILEYEDEIEVAVEDEGVQWWSHIVRTPPVAFTSRWRVPFC